MMIVRGMMLSFVRRFVTTIELIRVGHPGRYLGVSSIAYAVTRWDLSAPLSPAVWNQAVSDGLRRWRPIVAVLGQ